jgi:DNA-binding NarL/FixJ family response regulator
MADGGSMMAMVMEIEPKPLGLIWLSCSSPMLAFGLEKAVEAHAYVHQGDELPERSSPSLVVYELNEENIASGVQRVRVLAPKASVLVFAPTLKLSLVRTALREGARGFLHGGMTPEQILRALSVAAEGQLAVPRELLYDLLTAGPTTDLALLSARQQEVLRLVGEGMSNAQIAKRLYISESTVKQHLRSVYKALGVRNRTEVVRYLRDNNW